MTRLHLLGPPDLDGPGAANLLRQPKAVALLAYLALATPRGFHSRDTLMALLWPELDEERGRKALRQTLYEIRSALGKAAIENRGYDAVALGREVVTVDAVDLEELLEGAKRAAPAGASAGTGVEEAISLYRGELLEGFWVPEASVEWEQWLDGERSRLAREARNAAEKLAATAASEVEAAASSGTLTAESLERAIRLARRAVELAPLDEGPVARLLGLLGRAARNGAVVETFESYASRRQEALGDAPSEELAARRDEALAAGKAADTSTASPPRSAEVKGEARASDGGAVHDIAGQSFPLGVTGSAAVAAPARRRWLAAALIVGVLIAIAGTAVALRNGGGEAVEPAVVILPFRDLSAGGDQAHLAAGLQEQVAAGLSSVEGLRAIDGSSLSAATPLDPLTLARRTSAQGFVRAGVQREGDRIRVSAQLISGADQSVVWSEIYDRDLDMRAMLDIQADIGRSIARALVREVVGGNVVAAMPTTSLEAYELYLKGNEELYYRQGRARRGRDYMLQAIELDPSFALAWAGLSYAYGGLWQTTFEPHYADSAFAAAQHVAETRPDLPDGHFLLGAYYLGVRGDNEIAELHLRRALEIDPTHPQALQMMAWNRAGQDDYVGSLDAALRGSYEDPFYPDVIDTGATQLLYLHAYDEAEEWYEWHGMLGVRTVRSYDFRSRIAWGQGDSVAAAGFLDRMWELEPQSASAINRLAYQELWHGHVAVADSLYQVVWDLVDPAVRESQVYWTDLAYTRLQAGDTGRADTLLRLSRNVATRMLAEGESGQWVGWRILMFVNAVEGRADSAVHYLERYSAAKLHPGLPVMLRLDPQLAIIRDHPRAVDIARGVTDSITRLREQARATIPARLWVAPHLAGEMQRKGDR